MLKIFDGFRPIIAVEPWQVSAAELPNRDEIRAFEDLCVEIRLMRGYAPNVHGWPVMIRGCALPPLDGCGFYLSAMAVPAALNLLEELMDRLLVPLQEVGWQPEELPRHLDLDYLAIAQTAGQRDEMAAQVGALKAAMERIAKGLGDDGGEGPLHIGIVAGDLAVDVPKCLVAPVTSALHQLCQLFYVAGNSFQVQKIKEYQACAQ